jgi:hypothetical protein
VTNWEVVVLLCLIIYKTELDRKGLILAVDTDYVLVGHAEFVGFIGIVA